MKNSSCVFILIVLMAFPLLVKAQNRTEGIMNIVLVHGAFTDASSWSGVVSLLQTRGYEVIAVQNPLYSLKEDVLATKRAIDQMEGQVLLVGHSWAGMVITEAGNNPKVGGLVYVSAIVPDYGQSVNAVVKAFPPVPGNSEFELGGDGFLRLSCRGIDEYFAQDLSSKKRKVMFATQAPWAAISTIDVVTTLAWKTKPSWCIIATKDQIINPELGRAEAKMIKAKTLEINAGHLSMVSRPKKIANYIMGAARELPNL